MRHRIRIPYRFKILATVLVLVTSAVGIITFAMASMFHTDKTAYVSDLAAVMAVHGADQAALMLETQRNRLVELAEVIDDPDMRPDRKQVHLARLFGGSNGCVAVRVFERGREIGSLADTASTISGALARAALALPLAATAGKLAPGAVTVVGGDSGGDPRLVALLVAQSARGASPGLVMAALLDAERCFAVSRGSGGFGLFILESQGRVIWSSDPASLAANSALPVRVHIQPGSRAEVRTYALEGKEMIGGFSNVGIGGLMAGSQIPRSAAMFASRDLLKNLMGVALMLLLAAAVVSLIWSARITRSLSRLSEAARRIGSGDFSQRVNVRSADEMGDLADSFNHMGQELDSRERALREAQAQLIQSEKMAAFGQLGAGIAHEVKNPLAGILGMVQLSARAVPADHPIAENLIVMERETKRCASIIDNLLRFARQERSIDGRARLAKVVGDTVALMQHQMGLHGIQIEVGVDPELPDVAASANQLQQVLMNLMLNAQQAMEARGHGRVSIAASLESDGQVALSVSDDGPGIPKDIQTRIFEPFYTTKPAGKGTGLGLSVSFGIIRDQGGQILVRSEVGEGTTFIIRLPVASQPGEAATPDHDVTRKAA